MFSSDSYNPFILTFISAYEFTVSMIMIGALISTLLLWLKRKYNLTVLLYLMAFMVFLLATVWRF